MKDVTVSSSRPRDLAPGTGVFDPLARRLVLKRFAALEHGQLIIHERGQRHVFGHAQDTGELTATIIVNAPGFYGDIAFGGLIGAGEAWMQGLWDCDDLVTLVRLMIRNEKVLAGINTGFAAITRGVQRVLHRLNRNTRGGARRNIAAHYDLGNDFFSLWLDESMMYSSAIFQSEDTTLAQAQSYRLQRICERLQLSSDDHLLEIGTGWGGLAIYAARNFGCRVTTTTISQEQYDLARKRIDAAGLGERICLLLDDYRDLAGTYDKLVSVEMIEAIGSAQHETYFKKCAQLLRPGGRLLIQAITIEDSRYERYKNNVDFIQKYIFPGGCLPSQQRMHETIERVSDMQVESIDDIGLHYATTLRHWRRNFHRSIERVRQLGYSEAFIRMWDYYLCYCEGGFLERSISDIHLLAHKPHGDAANAAI